TARLMMFQVNEFTVTELLEPVRGVIRHYMSVYVYFHHEFELGGIRCSLKHHGCSLTYSYAHGSQSVAGPGFFHFMDQGGGDPGTGTSQGVAYGYGASVDIDPIRGKTQLFHAGNALGRKSF